MQKNILFLKNKKNYKTESKVVTDGIVKAMGQARDLLVSSYSKKVFDSRVRKLNKKVQKIMKEGGDVIYGLQEEIDLFIHAQVGDLLDFNKEKLEKRHYRSVANRKAINNAKYIIARKAMIDDLDINSLKNYQALKECEEKPIFRYRE